MSRIQCEETWLEVDVKFHVGTRGVELRGIQSQGQRSKRSPSARQGSMSGPLWFYHSQGTAENKRCDLMIPTPLFS